MLTIQILGTGCSKCKAMATNAKAAAEELELEFEIEKVTDIMKITSFGVMMTPALAVDGEVKIAGKVPTVAEAKELLNASRS